MKHRNGRTDDDYGISRIDDQKNRAHAWRVSFRRRGERHVKNFSDKKCGGRDSALLDARHYRDQYASENPPITRKEVCEIRRSNNRSGTTGVCTYAKHYKLSNGNVRSNWYWEASWPTELGSSAKPIFSVKTFGEDIARQLALNARREGLAAVEGAYWSSERGVVDDDYASDAQPSSEREAG